MPTPRPRQSTGILSLHAPDRHHGADDRKPVVHWQSLVDRRLIGAIPPLDPAVPNPIGASIRAAEAVLLPRRAGGVW